MKNLSLALNVILLLAVAFLFWREFSPAQPEAPVEKVVETPEAMPLKIAYVNADSLLENYDAFKAKRDELQKKQVDADNSLKARGRSLEREFMAVQERVQKGELTQKQIQDEEQRLGQKQQNLMAEQERVTKQLLDEGAKIQEELQDELISHLKDLKSKMGYDFILSYQPGGQILLANDSLDITKQVLQLLNAAKE